MVDFAGGSLFRPVQFDFTKGVEFIQRRDQLNLQAAQAALQAKQQQFNERSQEASSALRTQELMLRKGALAEDKRQFDARFALRAQEAASEQAAANALAGIAAHDVEQGPASTYTSFQNISNVRLPGTSGATFSKYRDQVAEIISENLDSADPTRRQEAIGVVLQDQQKMFKPEHLRRASAHVRSDYHGAIDEVRGAGNPLDMITADYQSGESPTSSIVAEKKRLESMMLELDQNPFVNNPAIIPRADHRQGLDAVQKRLDQVNDTLATYERGVRQYQSGAGAATAMDREALDMVWSSQFEQSFSTGEPKASGKMLREFAERTGYIPDSAAQTFSGWLDSPDNPNALMAASETWRQLESIGGGVAPFELQPKQAAMLAATKSVRRTLAREEQAALAADDGGQSMEAFGVLMADKVQSYIEGKKNSDASLASADMQRYMVGNEHGKALGLKKFRGPKTRGSGTEEHFSIPPDLQNDFETNFFIGMEETNDPEAASEYAFAQVKQNWSKSPFQDEPMAFSPSILSDLPEAEANERVRFELRADIHEAIGVKIDDENLKLEPRINNDGRAVYGVHFRDSEDGPWKPMLMKEGGPMIYSPEFDSVDSSKTRMVVNGMKSEEADAPPEIEEMGGSSTISRAAKALPGPSLGNNSLKGKLTSLGASLTRSKMTSSRLVRSRKSLGEALKGGGEKGDNFSRDLFGYFDLSTQANLETLGGIDPRAEALVDRNLLRVSESIRTIRNTIGETGRLPPELRMYEKVVTGEITATEAVEILKKNGKRREVADGAGKQ